MNNTIKHARNVPCLQTVLSAVALVLSLAPVCNARPVAGLPYEKLAKEADVIVIATPTQTKDSGEVVEFPGIARANEPVPGYGVNTTFEVLAVLKGGQDMKSLVLFHLREVELDALRVNAPRLVSFDPTEKKRYLMFLKREADGRFSSLCGQTDPAGAIKDCESMQLHPEVVNAWRNAESENLIGLSRSDLMKKFGQPLIWNGEPFDKFADKADLAKRFPEELKRKEVWGFQLRNVKPDASLVVRLWAGEDKAFDAYWSQPGSETLAFFRPPPAAEQQARLWSPESDPVNGLQCRLLPVEQEVEPSTGSFRDMLAYVTYELQNVSSRDIKFLPDSSPLQGVSSPQVFTVVDKDGDQVDAKPVPLSSNPVEFRVPQNDSKTLWTPWSDPVDGLQWRIGLAADTVKAGQKMAFDMEFRNQSDKALRILKQPTVSDNLYPQLYTSDGQSTVYSIEHNPEAAIKLADTVLIKPGETHKTTWTKMSTKQSGPAKLMIGYFAPKNTNPEVNSFWAGRLPGQTLEFTVLRPAGSQPEQKTSEEGTAVDPGDAAVMQELWDEALGAPSQEKVYKAVEALVRTGDAAVALAEKNLEFKAVGSGPFPETADQRRIARAIRMLELIGSEAAEDLLRNVVKQTEPAWPSLFAGQALKRLNSRPADAGIKRFGVNCGRPIYDGFLFFDGKYMPAPYVVERWGVDVYINGVQVERGDSEILGVAVVDEKKAWHEKRLREGKVIFDRTRGGEMSMGKDRGLERIEALLAAESGSQGKTPSAREMKARMAVEGFLAHPQLIRRMKRLGREVPVADNSEDAASSGKPSKAGLEVRLRAPEDGPKTKNGGFKFFVDARNEGKQAIQLTRGFAGCWLEVDGRWYAHIYEGDSDITDPMRLESGDTSYAFETLRLNTGMNRWTGGYRGRGKFPADLQNLTKIPPD